MNNIVNAVIAPEFVSIRSRLNGKIISAFSIASVTWGKPGTIQEIEKETKNRRRSFQGNTDLANKLGSGSKGGNISINSANNRTTTTLPATDLTNF